jgi:hypothetical protein
MLETEEKPISRDSDDLATNESQAIEAKLDDLLALAITDPIVARQQALAQEGGKVGRGKSSEKTAERQGARGSHSSPNRP